MKVGLKNAKVASAIGFLLLIALIWFLGPWFGLTMEGRFGWIIAVMLLWVLTLLIGEVLARRASGLLEGMLRKQADDAVMEAGADKRAEVMLLRQRLLGAIDTLKKSKLGHASGRAALYELPWYMVIGHPAAGKSSAILQSGLTFPFSDKSGIQGVGGTRNCDWFFSTEGILLDTAGRYATQSEDRVEWLEFLKLLKRHRPKAPVNGIMVAISLPELAQPNSEGFEVYARQVRERIHEIGDTFGLHVPVYLVFTKLDLLGGFAQFFQDADDEERSRVWGATLNVEQTKVGDVAALVSQQFELLAKGLVQAGEEKLLQYRGSEVRPAHFAFPIEFGGLKDSVVKFVRLLSEDDPYHARPLLRGFYFTSALQEGVPRIVTAARVKGQFGLGDAPARESKAQDSSNSFFLRTLFREVVFPDQHLISNQTRPRSSRWRVAGMVAGLLSLAVMTGLWSWSFIGNQRWLEEVDAELKQAHTLAASGQLYDRLRSLEMIQKRLEQLQAHRKDGTPWQVGLGLYQGKEMEYALRKEYFAGLNEVMLKPVKRNLETTLVALKPEPAPAPAPAPVVTPPKPEPKPEPKPVPRRVAPKPRSSGSALPNIKLGANHAVESPYQAVSWAAAPQRSGFVRMAGGGAADFRAMPVALGLPPAAKSVAAATEPATAEGKNNVKLDVGYNALKTYLMLHERKFMEEAHLSDQLPRYWRPWLESQRGQYSDAEIMAVAERLVAFYVSQIKEADLPLIDNDAKLVSNSRDVLRASFKRLSGAERVFGGIRAQANTRVSPLTVGRILDNRDLDIVAGSQMVEGAFTREGWDKYVKQAIDEASRGEIRGDDWVLASSLRENLSKDGSAEENRAELMALYQAQYAEQWKKFLQGIAIRDFTSPAQTASALARLSDPKTSPVKLILARAATETAWDNPSELQRSVETAKESVLSKTADFLKGGSDGQKKDAAAQFGVVGGQFAGVAQLVRGDTPPLNGYLEQLATLKAKMAVIASTDAPGAQARGVLQSTLNGGGGELAGGLAYVDNSLLSQVSAETRDMVRPFLVRPLMQSYSALLGPVAQDINQAWNNEVMPQWRLLAAKYPFSDAGTNVSIAELNRFVRPNDGTLDRFISKYLEGLVQKQGDTLVPRSWGSSDIKFNPAFLAAVSRLSSLASTQLQDGDNTRFELQPLPTPGLSEIVLELDGQELRYRNGAQTWQPFSWPGNGRPGASIQVMSYAGASAVVANQQGRMGWMRLLASAKVEQESEDSAVLSWAFKKPELGTAEMVRFNFRVAGGVNPLQLIRLRGFTLPDRVTL